MRVRILVQRGGRSPVTAGTIALHNGSLACDPPDSVLLRDILQQPVSLSIDGRVRDLYADSEPRLFLQALHQAYAGPFLSATTVEPLPVQEPGNAPGLTSEGDGAGADGRNGAREGFREGTDQMGPASASPSRTAVSGHELLGSGEGPRRTVTAD